MANIPFLNNAYFAAKVGIGTESPVSIVDISSTAPTLTIGGAAINQFESGRIRFTEFAGSSAGFQGSYIHYDGSSNAMFLGVHPSADTTVGNDVNAITILRASGNVGIGATPTAKLQVQGSGFFTNDIFTLQNKGIFFNGVSDFSSGIAGANSGTEVRIFAGGSERVRVDDSGNVGIGITSPATKLDVAVAATNHIQLGTSIAGTTGDHVGGLYYSSNKLLIESFLVGTGYQPLLLSPNGGNVGIGTTNPQRKFVVSNAGASGIEIQPNYVTGVNEILSFDRTVGATAYETMRFNGGDFQFQTSGSEKMVISSAGAIKFNAYSSTNQTGTPTYILGTDATGNVVKVLGGNIPGGGGTVTGNGANGEIAFWTSSSVIDGDSLFKWNASNNRLGVGVATPLDRLHVNVGTDQNIAFNSINSLARISSYNDAQTLSKPLQINGSDLRFLTGSSEKMRIDSAGNVGIGTTNPLHNLQIGTGGTNGSYSMMIEGNFANDALASNPRLNLIDTNFGITAGKYGSGSGNDALGFFAFQGAGRGMVFAHTTAGSSTHLKDMRQDMFIDGGTGNVGIGTTSPSQKLDVQGTILVNNEIQFVDANMRIFRSSNDMRFRTGGSDKVTIQSGGNVGINTTSPDATLEVVGGFSQSFTPSSIATSIRMGLNLTDGLQFANRRFTSISGTIASGVWIPIVTVADSGTFRCTLVTAAHSNVTFIASRGYNGSNRSHIQVLDWTYNPNGGYANVSGLRIRVDGQVEMQMTYSSGPLVAVDVVVNGDGAAIVASLAETTNVGGSVLDTVLYQNEGMMRSFGTMQINNTPALSSAATRFLVPDTTSTATNMVKSRTAAQVLSDIGGAPATGGSYLPLAGGTMTGPITLIDGSTTTTSINFTGDPNTGIYQPADNLMGFVSNGSRKLLVDTAGVTVQNGNLFINSDSTATTNNRIKMGAGSDLQLYHASSTNISFITNSNAGGLRLQSNELRIFANNGSTIRADFNTAVKLYYDDSKKFETTNTGVAITGKAFFNRGGTNGTIASPFFENIIESGLETTNASSIQLGNSFSQNQGTFLRFRVNSAAAASTPINALTLDSSGNAAFSGTINSGAITSTGAITGTFFTDGFVTWNGAQFNRPGAAIEFQFAGSTNSLVKFGANGSNPVVINANTGKVTGAATLAADGVSTLTTKSYVDGLVTGVPVYKGTWAAGTTGVTSAVISGTTIALTTAPAETIAIGDVVTADGITAAITVTAVASQTSVTVNASVAIASGVTVTFSPTGGYPDLTLAANKVLGNYYIVSTAGSAAPNGAGVEPDSWNVGDWCIFSDVTPGAGTDLWQKIDNTSVISGAGTGQKITKWAGTGPSETLTDSIMQESGDVINISGNLVALNTGATSLSKIEMQQSASKFLRLHYLNSGFTSSGTNYADSGLIVTGSSASNGMVLRVDANAPMRFVTGGNPSSNIRMTILGTGAVGIGEDNPVGQLDVFGSTVQNGTNPGIKLSCSNAQQTVFAIGNTSTRQYELAVGGTAGAVPGSFYIYDNDVSAFRMLVSTAGNVGITETNPLHKLSIKSTDNTRGILINNTLAGSYAELHLKANREYRVGTGGSATAADAKDNFYIYDATAATHRVTLTSAGDFGIGTFAPKSKLQVAGGIQMADDTDAGTTADKAGTMRYRTGTEYVEVTGTNIVTNGDFLSSPAGSGWATGTGWTITTGNATWNAAATYNWISSSVGTVVGNIYRVSFDCVVTSGNLYVVLGNGGETPSITATGSYEFILTPTGGGSYDTLVRVYQTAANSNFSITNISAIQVTAEDASYADMCMQTGASTYEWVNIVRNTY